MYKTIVQPDETEWDSFVITHARAHFLQIAAWGKLKSQFGWIPQRIALTDETGKIIAGAQILYRRLPYRLGKLAYIPFGPVVDWTDTSLLKAVFKAIDRTARREGAAFLKIEAGFDIDPKIIQEVGCRPSPQTVQPPSTLILQINGYDKSGIAINEDVILKRMNQGTRRNIRKSEKSGIVIRQAMFDDVASFNRLLHETSERKDFGVHDPAYYQTMYELFVGGKSPVKGALFLGSYTDETSQQSKDLAGVFVLALGNSAWYVAGASSDDERERRASFGVQWAAIQWARSQNVVWYDLYGIPNESEARLEAEFETRNEGLWGVYRFKRGWGGTIVRAVGAWDKVYNPLIYWLYRTYLFLRGGDNE
jgi:lipid II:glycine glycyltransferase (peptidoglycan interpeptide bridge formation enzyme)